MHLLSVFLSAAALFSHATTGFYLESKRAEISDHGFATLNDAMMTMGVGFSTRGTPAVNITLDPKGYLENNFLLREVQPDVFKFLAGEDAPYLEDIVGPFTIQNGTRQLVYSGEQNLVWAVCEGSERYYQLLLALRERTLDVECLHIELLVVEEQSK
ncbi:uncharacterized protein B0H64DRAFT_435930 [Chaetomium fimeti]|uniref:Uncharacterized protein n=1 Tax=Chaetomium fimeti TaxID=1854472 RepID=A0AAE0H877_9PEZI|nr:hypothetical protein B0H64DRAFT_435930 [Chaetomium fimeti]